MIVKVAPNRRDGKSSFEDLESYITEGIEQSGDRAERTSWDRLTQYITKQSVLDELGDDVEKTIAVEIGNVTSLKTAASEMFAVANRNKKVKNPVYHYILSWKEHERPDVQDVMAAARHTLKTLGLLEHQYIIAIHANTDNIHAHIEVNRVSGVTANGVTTLPTVRLTFQTALYNSSGTSLTAANVASKVTPTRSTEPMFIAGPPPAPAAAGRPRRTG